MFDICDSLWPPPQAAALRPTKADELGKRASVAVISAEGSNATQEPGASTAIPTHAMKPEAISSMSASVERFCLAAGLEELVI